MPLLLLTARLVLALVFGVAGVAKLADVPGSRRAMREFGLPDRLAGVTGLGLPLLELALAVALLPVAAAWYGAVGSLALLLLFVAGIGVNLARGRRPDCHCFGQVHSAPIGWPTLARNGVLAALAALIVWAGPRDPGPSVVAWIGDLGRIEQLSLAGGLVGLLVMLIEGWLLLLVLRQNGRLLLRMEVLEAKVGSGSADALSDEPSEPAPGLPIGATAPDFKLKSLHGETVSLAMLRAKGPPVLLVFTNPHCGPCQTLLPDIGEWQRTHADRLTVALVSEGTVEDNRHKAAEHGLAQVLLQELREVAAAYQVYATPTGVLVRPDGTIGSALAMGTDAVRQLATEVIHMARLDPLPVLPTPAPGHVPGHAGPAAQPVVQFGQVPPTLRFTALDGASVNLTDFRGSPTMLLFWNPSCGFCQAMLDDLKAWESSRPANAPRLLVISSGRVEANRALGLRSPVVLDSGFAAGTAFGAHGTPMAVLLDADGRVASGVVAGASAVLEMAGAAAVPVNTR